MIGYLKGEIIFQSEGECILDVNGVGYKIFVAENVNEGAAEFFIYTQVKEDAINLFGFKNRETLKFFEMLLSVSGIGAKSALAIISKITAGDFAIAVANQDLTALTKLPGVGKKSAQRLLLELKDKISEIKVTNQTINLAAFDEAKDALTALGYSVAEITAVFERADKNSSTEQLIKFALKELNRFA